jgi:hypothetical protein
MSCRVSFRLVTSLVCGVVLTACEQTPVTLPEATSLEISPGEIELTAGDMTAVSAQVLDQRGNVLRGAEVSWSTSAPGVAAIIPPGVVVAVAPGSGTLTARYGQLTATVPVTVSRDDRDLITSIEVSEAHLTADRRAGPQLVTFRAFDGRGRHRCDAAFQYHSSDRSVATAGGLPGCQIRIDPVGAGQTTVTVSSNGFSASFVVTVTISGHTAFFSAGPDHLELYAGNTVSYTVRVLDGEDQPLPGHRVAFEVSHGFLTDPTVTTDAQGLATVQWRLPRYFAGSGTSVDLLFASIRFSTQLPGGEVVTRFLFPTIVPAPASVVRLYRYDGVYWQPVSGSIQALAYSSPQLLAEAFDPYGNRRAPGHILFGIVSGDTVHYSPGFFASVSLVPQGVVRTYSTRWFYSAPAVLTVIVRDGEASTTVELHFTHTS